MPRTEEAQQPTLSATKRNMEANKEHWNKDYVVFDHKSKTISKMESEIDLQPGDRTSAALSDSSRKRGAEQDDEEADQSDSGIRKRSKTPLLEDQTIPENSSNVITLQQVQQRADEIKRMSGIGIIRLCCSFPQNKKASIFRDICGRKPRLLPVENE